MFRRIAIIVACIFALAQSSFAADEWAVGTWIQNYDWGKNDAHGQTTWTLDAEGNANESGGGLQLQKGMWEVRTKSGEKIIRVSVDKGDGHFEYEWPYKYNEVSKTFSADGHVYYYDQEHKFVFFDSRENLPLKTGDSNVTHTPNP